MNQANNQQQAQQPVTLTPQQVQSINELLATQKDAITGFKSGLETKDELIRIYRAQLVDNQNTIQSLQTQVQQLQQQLQAAQNPPASQPVQEPGVPVATSQSGGKVEVMA